MFFALCLGRKAEQGHMLNMLPQFMENSCKIMSFCSVLGDVGLSLHSHWGAFSVHTNYSHWLGTLRKLSHEWQCRHREGFIASVWGEIRKWEGSRWEPPCAGRSRAVYMSRSIHCSVVVSEQKPNSLWAPNYTFALLLWWRLIWLGSSSFDVKLILIGLFL